MTDLDVLHELNRQLVAGKPVVMATLVRTSGSSPRRVGARMLILSEADIEGTIGGGKFEAEVIKDSLALLTSGGRHLLKTYRFTSIGEGAIGMSCGGEADVFIEAFRGPDRLLIFGGGHIGRALANQALGSGFAVTVVDDRPEVLAGFDESVQVCQADNNYAGNLPDVDSNSYVVIVTRSHDTDRLLLKKFADESAAYVGMMGSQAKIAKVFAWLAEQGVGEEALNRVYTPIGEDIEAEGPYEIGVSIMAELIKVRHTSRQVHVD